MDPLSVPSLTRFKKCNKCGVTYPRIRLCFHWNGTKWRAACKPCERLRKRAYNFASMTPEARQRRIESSKRWLKKSGWKSGKRDKDKVRRASRKYWSKNKEKARERSKQWYRANRVEQNNRARKRKGILRDAQGSHSSADVRSKYESQGGKCHWCSTKLNGVFEVDHIFPLSKGGSNDPSNICCACQFCNRSKGSKMPWEYLEYLKERGA